MAIPILKLGNILLAPLQGDLTDHDVLAFQDDILHKVKNTIVDGVIIDLMGLDLVDSFMVRVINETAQMIGMLGVKIIICGMQPAIALTLSEMGRNLMQVITALNLDFALEKMQQLLMTSDTLQAKKVIQLVEQTETLINNNGAIND